MVRLSAVWNAPDIVVDALAPKSISTYRGPNVTPSWSLATFPPRKNTEETWLVAHEPGSV